MHLPDPVRYAVPGFILLVLVEMVFWAAFHEWIGITHDLWRAPGLRAKLGYLVMPPGWSHDGSRDTSATIKAQWRAKLASVPASAGDMGDPAWKKPTSSSSGADRAEQPQPGA